MSADSAVVASTSPNSSSCNTKVEPIRLKQDWTIENFSPLLKLCKPGHCLRSHVFRHNSLSEATWQLCLYPAGKRAENQGYVSLFLKMSSTTPNREILVTAEYKFHFLDDSRQIKFTNVNVGDFHAKPPKCGHSWGLRNIPRQRVVQSLRSDGSLLVHCEIEFLPDPCRLRSHVIKSTAVSETDLTQVARSYVDNMLSLFQKGVFTDCRIVVKFNNEDDHCGSGGSNFCRQSSSRNVDNFFFSSTSSCNVNNNDNSNGSTPNNNSDFCLATRRPLQQAEPSRLVVTDEDTDDDADDQQDATPFETSRTFDVHKCILAAHSDVFRAMFEPGGMIESEKNSVIICDFNADAVESMLEYVYSGELPENRLLSISHIVDVMALAEKYSLFHLKSLCEDRLSLRIAKDTVCHLYAVADLHQAAVLKRACMQFFVSNRQAVLSSDDWQELKERNPKLGNEILEHILRIQNNEEGDQQPPEKRTKLGQDSNSYSTYRSSNGTRFRGHVTSGSSRYADV